MIPQCPRSPRSPALRRGWRPAGVFAGLVLFCFPAVAQVVPPTSDELELAQLMSRTVTYVQSPAAMYMLPPPVVRHQTVDSLPDLLRRFPGIEVSQNNAHRWAVGVRGFGSESGDRLALLIDGRAVSGTALGGIRWDNLDLFLKDTRRVEVRRGLGATFWDNVPVVASGNLHGAINVQTMPAGETPGTLVRVEASDRGETGAAVRHGGAAGPTLSYRIHGQAIGRGPFERRDGSDAHDRRTAVQGGFRIDWQPTPADQFMFAGGYHAGTADDAAIAPVLAPPFAVIRRETTRDEGGSVQARWTHDFHSTANFYLQASHDRAEDETPLQAASRATTQVEAQFHRILPGHAVIASAGYLRVRDELTPSADFSFTTPVRTEDHLNAFLQDTIELGSALQLTAKAKVERNPYTDVSFGPAAHLFWQIDERQGLWGGVGRAFRAPTRTELEGRRTTAAEAPATLRVNLGHQGLAAERLTAYELGYRLSPSQPLLLEFSGYYNQYDRLIGYRPAAGFAEAVPAPAHWVEPSVAANLDGGRSVGLEASVRYIRAPWWMSASYAWSESRLPGEIRAFTPRHFASMRVNRTLWSTWEWETGLSYFGASPTARAHLRWDTGLLWRPNPAWEISLMAKNLLSPRHREFHPQARSGVPRSLVAKTTWSF